MEPTFWCCGLRLWTTAIAWIQIVMSLIGSLLFLFVFIELAIIGPEELKAKYLPNAIDGATSEFVYYMLMTSYQLVLASVGLTFGVFLLLGASQKRIRFLKMWLVFAMVTMVYSVIAVGVQGFQARYSKSTAEVVGLIISSAGTIAFNGFSLYIVQDFIDEIKCERYEADDDEEPLIEEDPVN